MRITKKNLKQLIREEMRVSGNHIDEITDIRTLHIKRQLERKWKDASSKNPKDQWPVRLSRGVNAAKAHLKTRKNLEDEDIQDLEEFIRNIGGTKSLAFMQDAEAEDIPDKGAPEHERTKAHLARPDKAGGKPKIVRTGQTKTADVFTVSTSKGELDYTRVMADIISGKKVLKSGMGGSAYRDSDDLKKRQTWAQIKVIQALLVAAGYADGLFSRADGNYGPKTKKAVIKMQKHLGLTVDGVIGRQTATAFNPKKKAQKIPITGQEISRETENMILDLPPDTTFPGEEGKSAPAKKEKGAPAKKEKGAPAKKEKGAPAKEDEGGLDTGSEAALEQLAINAGKNTKGTEAKQLTGILDGMKKKAPKKYRDAMANKIIKKGYDAVRGSKTQTESMRRWGVLAGILKG